MIEYVAGFLFDSHFNHVLLVRKQRPAWQAGRLNAIGGHVEAGEVPATAMVREFEEETTLRVESWKPLCGLNGSDQDGNDWKVHFFYAVKDRAFLDGRMSPDEPIETHDLTHTRDRLPNLAWLIPMAKSLHEGLDRAHHFKVVEKYAEPAAAEAAQALSNMGQGPAGKSRS